MNAKKVQDHIPKMKINYVSSESKDVKNDFTHETIKNKLIITYNLKCH